MKKSVVAIMLSLVIAAGGIGAAPAYAAERAVQAEEAITHEQEGDEAQAEAREEADSDGEEDAAPAGDHRENETAAGDDAENEASVSEIEGDGATDASLEAAAGTAEADSAQDGESGDGESQDGESQDGEHQDGDLQDGDLQDGEPQDGELQDGEPRDEEQPIEITEPQQLEEGREAASADAKGEDVAQAIYTADNNTFTFYYGPLYSVGESFGGHTIKDIWSGTAVTESGKGIRHGPKQVTDLYKVPAVWCSTRVFWQ